MGEPTLVKADKQLVKQAHELGANVRRIVDLALEDYIRRNSSLKPEIRAVKRPSRECNGGTVIDNEPLQLNQPDNKTPDSTPRKFMGSLSRCWGKQPRRLDTRCSRLGARPRLFPQLCRTHSPDRPRRRQPHPYTFLCRRLEASYTSFFCFSKLLKYPAIRLRRDLLFRFTSSSSARQFCLKSVENLSG